MSPAEIHIDQNIKHGHSVFKGTRIPVYEIIEALLDGGSKEDVLEAYPSLTMHHLALVDEVVEQFKDLDWEIARITGLLLKFGCHRLDCRAKFVPDSADHRPKDCTCGWAEIEEQEAK